MDQGKTPIIDALRAFAEENRGYFNIPGHRGSRGVDPRLERLLGGNVFEADRTETDGLDDLHLPRGVIREAQMLAAELYGSDACWFLVNGTTCANEAMILAAAGPGEKILVPRNAHKSVLMGLVLSGAGPVWYLPEKERETGLYGAVSPEVIRKKLASDPDIRAVFLVSPTYYGSCSDITAAAEAAHSYHVPLLVDEAHGAHFYFHEGFPEGAVAAGADLVAQSTHKTQGSLTQSAMLHLSGNLVSRSRVEACLKLVQSTSPSYPLMVSLDGTRHLMAADGRNLMARAANLAHALRKSLLSVPGIEVYHCGTDGDPAEALPGFDPCRVVFSAKSRGISGHQLQEELFRRHITTEMADSDYVVAVVTHANTEQEIRRLCEAAREIAQKSASSPGRHAYAEDLCYTEADVPETIMRPRDAFFAPQEPVLLEEAAGRVAGEMAAPYPPGIPLIYPGERMTEEICRRLAWCRACGIPVHGPADPGLNWFQCVKTNAK